MAKTAFQLNREILQLSRRCYHARMFGKDTLRWQLKLDDVIAELDELLAIKRKEDEEVQVIIEELRRESILED